MAHHAYLYIGAHEPGIRAARAFAAENLGIDGANHSDLAVFSYEGLFPKEHAHRIITLASQAPVEGDKKLIVIAAGRLFPPSQNALLKLFEEPSEGTTLILIVPAEGMLLPTLRSRLIELPRAEGEIDESARLFLSSSRTEREKLVAKLVARVKSDNKDEDKQAARMEAVRIAEGLIRVAHARQQEASGEEKESLTLLLADLDRFMPILHTSSAPLKLIFEHLLIVMPESLSK
ncbi:MAG: hypothetical protein V4682_01090 [Patescibacteria group bacterium]